MRKKSLEERREERMKMIEERDGKKIKIIIEILIQEINFNPSPEMLSNPYPFAGEIHGVLEEIEPFSLKKKVLFLISEKLLGEDYISPENPIE